MDDSTIEFAIDTAKFYGALLANGVPPEHACRMAQQFVASVIMCPANYADPDGREPWEQ